MKIIYLILLLTFISCGKSNSQNKIETKEQIVELDVENKYWDSICKNETKNAEKDIIQNKLTYFHSFGMVTQYRSNAEMDKLLSKYKIGIGSVSYYCTVPGELQNCYAHKMEQEIEKRYGKNFIDSLRIIAEKQYVKNNPNKIYSFDECDTIARYPKDKTYRDFFKSYERDFWTFTEYPSDFEFRKINDYYSSISAEFTLSKEGIVSDVDIEITFQNKKNYKYTSYFTNKIKEFISKTKWIPAKSAEITVSSKVPLTIFFK